MEAKDSPFPNPDSDSDTKETNHIPESDSSNALVPAQSNSPAVCLLRVTEDGAAGALMGSIFGYVSGLTKMKGFKGSFVEARSYAKTFAVLSRVHSLVACFLKRIRGKDDAGCCTGLALSFPGAPQALLQSCITFGAFSFIIEGLNKLQPVMALSFSARNKLNHYDVPHLLALPLAVPLPDELKGAFSFFYKSLRKPRNSKFPSSH